MAPRVNNNSSRSRYKVTTRLMAAARRTPPFTLSDGFRHTSSYTEPYIEDLSEDIDRDEIDATVQTDPVYNTLPPEDGRHTLKSARKVAKTIYVRGGVDAGTQILPGELYNFDEEARPLIESMVGRILEQVKSILWSSGFGKDVG